VRTTLTLDPDTAALLQRRMAQTGESLKAVVNEAIRAGLVDGPRQSDSEYRLVPRDMGEPRVSVTQALRLAADLEDEEIARKLAIGR
jgi:hypothetical protein